MLLAYIGVARADVKIFLLRYNRALSPVAMADRSFVPQPERELFSNSNENSFAVGPAFNFSISRQAMTSIVIRFTKSAHVIPSPRLFVLSTII